jgi:hypothetical protein
VLNMNAGATVDTSAVVAVGADGKIAAFNHSGTTGLRVTVDGFFTTGTTTSPGGYVPVTQTRLLDTRSTGAPLSGTSDPAAHTTSVDVTSMAGFPGSVSSAWVNLTVPSPSAAGSITVMGGDGVYRPVLDFGTTSAPYSIGAVVPVVNGSIYLATTATIDTDVIVDLYGFYDGSLSSGGSFTPIQARLLDTRNTAAVPAYGSVSVAVGGTNGIPSTFGAATLGITTISGTGSGYLIAWPTGQTMPSTSMGNFPGGGAITSAVATVQPGTSGQISIYNHSSTATQVIVDLEGWYSIDQELPTPDPTDTAPEPLSTDPGPKPGADTSQSATPSFAATASPSSTNSPASTPASVSGQFTNGAGTPLSGLSVTLSATDAITESSNEAQLPVVATVTTASDGTWSYTFPDPLPSNLQSLADANDGVLNLMATANGVTSSGVTLTAEDSLSAGVAFGSSDTAASDDARSQFTPHVLALHPATTTDSSPVVSGTLADQITQSSDPTSDYQPAPSWQSSVSDNTTGFQPDALNGTDYSAVTPAYQGGCSTTYTTIGYTIQYTTVGEGHAFWDATASYHYNYSTDSEVGVEYSADGEHWSLSGSVALNRSFGASSGFSGHGPYFGEQWQIPLEYAKIRAHTHCLYGNSDSYHYLIKALGYNASGHYAGRYGKQVTRFDGVDAYDRSPSSWRTRVYPGSDFDLQWGRGVTYSWAADAFGVGITITSGFNATHDQGITAGNQPYDHDIWGMRGPLSYADNPGGFYSW